MLRCARRSAREIREASSKDLDFVYVPYPAILCCYLLAIKRRRSDAPLLVIDCFISVYDTVVEDRKLLSPSNPLAMLIRYMEKKAIQRADLVLTDTAANASYLAQLYPQERNGLANEKSKTLNLCINEALFLRENVTASVPDSTDSNILNVLFVGSFVPLQGVELIIEAATLLEADNRIKFTLLGDGQTADRVQQLIAKNKLEINWQRGWHPIEKIAEAIYAADVCLGVFGEGGKASRVLPYKIYMAMAGAKPVISIHMDHGVSPAASIPMLTLQQNTARQLADAITGVLESSEERLRLGREGIARSARIHLTSSTMESIRYHADY
jgi:glycosyltransferase involved in cell wall biosynthesis